MSMIFPGMDPYLEDPAVWPGVHSRMVVYLADYLQPRLQPRYIAAVEERVFVEETRRDMIPDVVLKRRRPGKPQGRVAVLEGNMPEVIRVSGLEIHESYVTILDRHSGQKIVTVIELVSPTNKYAGAGRDSYVAKQRDVLGSEAHLVEIDLLRAGPHVLTIPEWAARGRGPYDYLVCVNRAVGLRDEYEVYRQSLRVPLTSVRVPLADGDPDAMLDIQAVLSQVYDAGFYRDLLAYDRPCVPPLPPADQAWADERIRAATAEPSQES
ncbi:MAG: DUF4058 family protein [Isosphaeraceae bacterium]|nr:DUF4058 family protein [Isosphaeraceae bacterium]